jgi:hypothetical protein
VREAALDTVFGLTEPVGSAMTSLEGIDANQIMAPPNMAMTPAI